MVGQLMSGRERRKQGKERLQELPGGWKEEMMWGRGMQGKNEMPHHKFSVPSLL